MLGALSATALVVALAGCGSSGGSYANASRPPAPISVAIYLTDARVAVSPAHVGAGPVLLLIANESTRSRNVTLTAPAGASDSCVTADASSGPINPQGTARVKLPLVQGTCAVGDATGRLRPARLVVGPQRQSAQQDLLQP
jgi:hypothetical protein